MFLTISLNPTIQKTIALADLHEGEVNRSKEHYLDASGKGINVTRVLTQLGEEVLHITQCGGKMKNLFLSLTKKDKIKIKSVDSKSEIRFAYTLLNKTLMTTTEIVEEAYPVTDTTEEEIFNLFLLELSGCNIVIISGSRAAGFSETIFPRMVQKAKEFNKRVILDYRGADLLSSLTFSPDIIKPNLDEFLETFFPEAPLPSSYDGTSLNDGMLNLVKEKMSALKREYNAEVIVTNGSDKILYTSGTRIKERFPVKVNHPVNATGCGDAFTAGLATYIKNNKTMEQAISKAMECAELNIKQIRPGVIK